MAKNKEIEQGGYADDELAYMKSEVIEAPAPVEMPEETAEDTAAEETETE